MRHGRGLAKEADARCVSRRTDDFTQGTETVQQSLSGYVSLATDGWDCGTSGLTGLAATCTMQCTSSLHLGDDSLLLVEIY
jgi:hypothetical protein